MMLENKKLWQSVIEDYNDIDVILYKKRKKTYKYKELFYLFMSR